MDGWFYLVLFICEKYLWKVFDIVIGIGFWVIEMGDEYLDVEIVGMDFLLI